MSNSKPYLLAIESTCDDTGAAVAHGDFILSNVVANQVVHKDFGGVVPELASRAHEQHILPTVSTALKKANCKLTDLDAVACSLAPGLLGSLLVGNSFAKGIALSLQIPFIGVDHLQAHILAHFITDPKPTFPFLALTVSGGHTQIVLVKDYFNLELLGQTLDDAVGEAFDKTATLLGLPYPGGKWIDHHAQKGDSKRFQFPKVKVKGLNFSFSGLKTAFLYFLRDQLNSDPKFINTNLNDICASMQAHLVNSLLDKLKRALRAYPVNRIAIGGGVASNSYLRNQIRNLGHVEGLKVYVPDLQYCTDNAAMVAITAYYQYIEGKFTSLETLPQTKSFAFNSTLEPQ